MQNRKLLIVLLVLVVAIGLAVIFAAGLLYLVSVPAEIPTNSVVEVRLAGTLAELPADDPLTLLFAPDTLSLWDLHRVFKTAAADDRVKAIYVEIHPLLLSFAQLEELRDSIGDFRRSGKKVHAFLAVDMATESELYLSSAADSVTLNPTGGLLFDGLMAEVVFMKRTMDMLRIKPQFLQLKEYKNPQTYSRRSMTPEFREMYRTLLTDIQDRLLETLSVDRELDVSVLRELMAQGMLTAEVAHESGLVDQLGYRAQVRARLREEAEGAYERVSAARYLKARGSFGRLDDHRVAIVEASGLIIAGDSPDFGGVLGGTTLGQQLREIRERDLYDGVILRINSPGGSAVGSDMVWNEVKLLEEAGKPVVVSMSDVAGSGGYYIAMSAGQIVAQPSTITGSIGVIFGKYDASGLYDWLGMDIDRIKLAENADILSLTSSLNDSQLKQVEAWMEQVYESFVSKAAEGRKTSYEELEPKAHGRIYTGAQALEAGLVDHLGGLRKAVEVIRTSLQVEESRELRIEVYPRPKTLWESLTTTGFIRLWLASDLQKTVSGVLRQLETPSVWLLTPEVRIY